MGDAQTLEAGDKVWYVCLNGPNPEAAEGVVLEYLPTFDEYRVRIPTVKGFEPRKMELSIPAHCVKPYTATGKKQINDSIRQYHINTARGALDVAEKHIELSEGINER